MAEIDAPVTQSEVKVEEGLTYLDYAWKVYGYAKDNSGPLKPSVETIESTLKTVVGPAYDKLHEVPVEVLKLVDHKVDESASNHVQPLVSKTKNLSSEVTSASVVETAAGLAKTAYTKLEPTAKELYTKYEPTAKELYTKYEPVAEQYAASSWQSLNQLPFFPKVAKVVVPSAAYCSDKYNQTVQETAEKGYKLSSYLPLVPTDKIAKVFQTEQ